MDRRNLLTAILFGFIPLSSAVSFAENYHDHGRDKGKKKRQNEDHGGDQDRRYFRSEDFSLLDGYYSGPRNLPPGLRKKYYRTGALPPGWEKKLQPFPPELVRQLPPPPPNCERGYINGVAIIYDRKTRIILDSIDLMSAVTGH
jgi:hypothetical protein